MSDFIMGFFKRNWSDADKWLMGLVFALVVVGSAALTLQSPQKAKTLIALIAGYDSAAALAMHYQGDDITKIKVEIDARIRQLGLMGLPYPADPGNGVPVASFANRVIGYLSTKSKTQTCAFQLGFIGSIESNTPKTIPDFSMRKTANCAGFAYISQQSDEEYLHDLVESTRETIDANF
ncbi:MAG: hypothetical protein ACR2O0_10100 [Rhizobiaceae bacterium]